jgi:hypothetical protein
MSGSILDNARIWDLPLTWNVVANQTVPTLNCDKVIQWANDALMIGFDCQNLRILAGLTVNSNHFEIREYARRSIRDLRLPIPERIDAAVMHVCGNVKALEAGECDSLLDALEEISELSRMAPHIPELGELSTLFWELTYYGERAEAGDVAPRFSSREDATQFAIARAHEFCEKWCAVLPR